jgi:hypothetical protein
VDIEIDLQPSESVLMTSLSDRDFPGPKRGMEISNIRDSKCIPKWKRPSVCACCPKASFAASVPHAGNDSSGFCSANLRFRKVKERN